MNEQSIKRINELYHKAKTEGLTAEEAEEQKRLRQEYLAAIRADIRSSLDNVSIAEPDGTITQLKKKG